MALREFKVSDISESVYKALGYLEKKRDDYLETSYYDWCNSFRAKISKKRKYIFFGDYLTITDEELRKKYYETDEWGESILRHHQRNYTYEHSKDYRNMLAIMKLAPIINETLGASHFVTLNEEEVEALEDYLK